MSKSERWAQIGGEIYSVEFLGSGWAVMRFDDGVGTTVFKAGKGDAGKEAAIAHLEDMRKDNPVKRKTKKKRSPKQLANDKRLGRMAKKRAAAKRGRKVSKKKKLPKRKVNPKRASSAKSHLWVVFRCFGRDVAYLTMDGGRVKITGSHGAAILFKRKSDAMKSARSADKRYKGRHIWGIANADKTGAQIRNQCEAATDRKR